MHSAWAQLDPEFLDGGGNIGIYGGITYPSVEFSSTGTNGLYAQNGFHFGIEGNYIIKYGFGIGVDLGGEGYSIDKQAFRNFMKPETMEIKGGYSGSYFGINLVANVPIVIDDDHFTINLFGVGTAGLRGVRIPEIDLTYSELENKYVEVSYRARPSTSGYISYRGGMQLLFNNKFGISFSYKAVLRSQHKLKYSVRAFDTDGVLFEDENFMVSYFDSESYQFGLVFLLGVD